MFKKNTFKKTNIILLIVFVLNLGLWNLFSTPMQAEACVDPNTGEITNTHCYSCDTSTSQCITNPAGPYWSPMKCNNVCSSISDATDVNVPAPTTPPNIPVDPSTFFDAISNLSDGAETADYAISIIINELQKNGKIPEEYKQWVIDAIQKDGDIDQATKTLFIDAINGNDAIPESLKTLLISIIEGNTDIAGLVKNWILDLLLKHVDIEHICKSFSDIAANIMVWGTSVGTPLAIAISQLCPIILNEILQAFLQTLPEPPAPANMQTIQYPIFESYQWEIGIPGFTKPGEITPFK